MVVPVQEKLGEREIKNTSIKSLCSLRISLIRATWMQAVMEFIIFSYKAGELSFSSASAQRK